MREIFIRDHFHKGSFTRKRSISANTLVIIDNTELLLRHKIVKLSKNYCRLTTLNIREENEKASAE